MRPVTVLIPCALAAALALAAPAAASPLTCDDALRAVQGGVTRELMLACDDARDRPLSYQATKPPQITLSPTAGSVRVKLGGGWRSLTRARTVTHPVVIDASHGRVKLAARYGLDDSHSSGTFSYGMFKVEHGPAQGSIAPRRYSFSKIALVGPRCGGTQARDIDGTVSRGRFTLKTARFSATALARSRFTLGDLCVGVSVVEVRSGRVIAPGGEVLHTNESHQEPQD